MSELTKPKRSVPWGVFLFSLFVLLGGSWVLWDMKPWIKDAPIVRPASTIRILGRDDEAAKKAEAELDSPASANPRTAPSSKAGPAPSAPTH